MYRLTYAAPRRRRRCDRDLPSWSRSEDHTSELQSQSNLVCRLLLEKKNATTTSDITAVSQPIAAFSDSPNLNHAFRQPTLTANGSWALTGFLDDQWVFGDRAYGARR